MPAAFYRIARNDKNPNPIVITPEGAVKTSHQARAFLLCSACERRFNENGESWMLKNYWRSETDFPLHAALQTVQPHRSTHGLLVYETVALPDLDVGRLVYFAASVFWRGAVREWRQGRHRLEQLSLGPYEEQLRTYLLGTSALHADIAMVVTVSSSTRQDRVEYWSPPWLALHDQKSHQYHFIIPGVMFQMFVGKGIPLGLRRLCAYRGPGRPICMSAFADATNVRATRRLMGRARAHAKGDLR